MRQAHSLLEGSSVVFWDFDGVILDSVGVKSVAFEQLFLSFGRDLADRVRRHHEAHGGLSRFEKIPLYLGWAGEAATGEQVRIYCDRFSQLARQAVIESPWVPGVREYLEAHHARQHFVLVTATPEAEMLGILKVLGISGYFREVHGAPAPKAAAIAAALRRLQCRPEQALVVGDSETDLAAAMANGVPFLLRRTMLNRGLQERYSGPAFDNLSDDLE